MNELVNLVAQKVGISTDQARTAVDAVLGYLKEKLPAPLAGHLDQALSSGAGGSLGEAAKKVGGLFGQ